MSTKLLVTLRAAEDAQIVRDTGCEILAEYPSSLLVRCTGSQVEALRAAGIEFDEFPAQQVNVTGASFSFEQAVDANDAAPVTAEPTRNAYFLVQLVGPVLPEWLEGIKGAGAEIYSTLPGYTLLAGMLPRVAQQLLDLPWVEAVTPYRAAMKVSPHLRPGVTRDLTTANLESVESQAGDKQQVEINVFPKESTSAISARIRSAGGVILEETASSLVAFINPALIPNIAEEQGILSILPHEFPEFHNDRAAVVMHAPASGVYDTLTLRGAGQIIGIADSGLDTGDPATLHLDIRGRVVGLTSQATRPELRPFTNDVAPFDDGPSDPNSAHGTHVNGSVLGNGAEAVAHASTFVPQGLAPEAQVFFQAIEQSVNWKTTAQLAAVGLAPFTMPWPPSRISLWGLPGNLNDLFTAAYTAGARLHTNSWGAPVGGVYNTSARQVDEFLFNNRDMLILFSAGNSGRDNDASGVIDPDSIGSPGTAKNCLTVGASENNRPHGSLPTPGFDGNWSGDPRWTALGAAGHVSDNIDGMAAFSSRGPTDDGRIKPDVVAPGINILSTRSSLAGPDPLHGDMDAGEPLRGLYCWSGGTSMSTPLVAGAAVLVRQHLVQHRGHVQAGVKPSGALIKAMLVNGATVMPGQFTGEIPAGQNNVSGFGRVNVEDSLVPGLAAATALHQTLFADEPEFAVQTGQMREFQVQPVDTALPVKVTLVWTDAPAAAGVGGLINQLYLQVVLPDGTIRNGDLTAFPTVSNNVQQVIIAAPVMAGTYTIRVRGVSVTVHAPSVSAGPATRQDFALAASNIMGPSHQPVSIAQAIDTTGSMDFFGYIGPAKERATQLVDFLRSTDSVSITEFSQRFGPPLARTVHPLHLLASYVPDWTDAHASISGLVANGLTPIGAGLLEAWNQLNTPLSSTHRGIVLLSDGLQNVSPDPFDPAVLPVIPASVPIFTVALGPASSAPTLQNIAASRPGGSYFEVYTDQDIHKLHEIYATLQALVGGAVPIGLDSAEIKPQEEGDHEIPVEPGVQEATFTLSWAESNKEIQFLVIGPDGQQYDADSAATMERIGSTYRYVRVGVPAPGSWKVIVRNRDGQKPFRYTISAAAHSPLVLSADPGRVMQDKLLITARLHRGGVPLAEAEVMARVTLPGVTTTELLKQFERELNEIKLPETVDEPGLSETQRQLLRLSVFARKFLQQEGGIFKRNTVDVTLTPQGEGIWAAEVPLSAPGNVGMEITAGGMMDGVRWQRVVTQSVYVPEPAETAQKIEIRRIFTRRFSRWHYTQINAEVLKTDGSPATPADGAKVSMIVTQGTQRVDLADVPYNRNGYYAWGFKKPGFTPGTATVTVKAQLDGQSVRATKVVRI